MTAPFTVVNGGVLPLGNVQIMMGLCAMSPKPSLGLAQCDGELKTLLAPSTWTARTIYWDEGYTVMLDDFVHPEGKLPYADIAIDVRYQPWFLPIKLHRQFRYFEHINDGTSVWFSRPLDK